MSQATIRGVVSELRTLAGLNPFNASFRDGDFTIREHAVQYLPDENPVEIPAEEQIRRMAESAGLSPARLELLRQGIARREFLEVKLQEASNEHRDSFNQLNPDLRHNPRRVVDQIKAAVNAAEACEAAHPGQFGEHVDALKRRLAVETKRAEAIEAEIGRLNHNLNSAMDPIRTELSYLKTIIPVVFDEDGDGILPEIQNPRTALERAIAAVAADEAPTNA